MTGLASIYCIACKSSSANAWMWLSMREFEWTKASTYLKRKCWFFYTQAAKHVKRLQENQKVAVLVLSLGRMFCCILRNSLFVSASIKATMTGIFWGFFISLDWDLDGPGFEFRQKQEIFSFPKCPDRL